MVSHYDQVSFVVCDSWCAGKEKADTGGSSRQTTFVSPAFEMGDGDDRFWGKARPFGLGFTRVWKPTRADDNQGGL
jgi:hypothetical protein